MKSFCATKETTTNIKRQPIQWEKIFANHASDMRLIWKQHKNIKKLWYVFIKNSKTLSFVATWMKIKSIMLGEISKDR